MIGNLLIRVDCNPEIASGHLMRCLCIASEASYQGLNVIFLMSDGCHKENIERRGFSHYNLNSNWRSLDSEIPELISIINSLNNPILLIDTYSITSAYVGTLKKYLPVLYLGSKQTDIGQPDGIINYSSKIDYAFYKCNFNHSKTLLGVKFAPLRKDFHKINRNNPLLLTDILLTTGGTDRLSFTTHFLTRNLNLFNDLNLNCHVVIGPMFENISDIIECANLSSHITLYRNITNMAVLMKSCQLAVSANGTTVYELAACGIPTISFAIAREQEISGSTLGKKGIVDYCGLYPGRETECMENITNRLKYYKKHPDKRFLLGQRASSMIDGRGCEYIINFIKKIREKW